MTEHNKAEPQFFLTAPQPCPYLAERFERKIFTYLTPDNGDEINSLLTQGGFRRSQNIAYRPVCDGCQACVSVRIVVNDFCYDKTMKRIWKKNSDLIGQICHPKTTSEQYALFKDYLLQRHKEGGMSDMSADDYQMMVEDAPAKTQIIEYRHRPIDNAYQSNSVEELVGVALTDIINDGLSMVYSYYKAEMAKRSLGTFLILDHIERARKLGLSYVYLGYWVQGSQKMQYKSRFQPQEHLTANGWRLVAP